jgi:hypothetical protein
VIERMVKTTTDGTVAVPTDRFHAQRDRSQPRFIAIGKLQIGPCVISRCHGCGRLENLLLWQRPRYAWQAYWIWELYLGPIHVRWYA